MAVKIEVTGVLSGLPAEGREEGRGNDRVQVREQGS